MEEEEGRLKALVSRDICFVLMSAPSVDPRADNELYDMRVLLMTGPCGKRYRLNDRMSAKSVHSISSLGCLALRMFDGRAIFVPDSALSKS